MTGPTERTGAYGSLLPAADEVVGLLLALGLNSIAGLGPTQRQSLGRPEGRAS